MNILGRIQCQQQRGEKERENWKCDMHTLPVWLGRLDFKMPLRDKKVTL